MERKAPEIDQCKRNGASKKGRFRERTTTHDVRQHRCSRGSGDVEPQGVSHESFLPPPPADSSLQIACMQVNTGKHTKTHEHTQRAIEPFPRTGPSSQFLQWRTILDFNSRAPPRVSFLRIHAHNCAHLYASNRVVIFQPTPGTARADSLAK